MITLSHGVNISIRIALLLPDSQLQLQACLFKDRLPPNVSRLSSKRLLKAFLFPILCLNSGKMAPEGPGLVEFDTLVFISSSLSTGVKLVCPSFFLMKAFMFLGVRLMSGRDLKLDRVRFLREVEGLRSRDWVETDRPL